MIGPMLQPSLAHSHSHSTTGPSAVDATDWPELWQLLLQARLAPAGLTEPLAPLRPDALHGWQLHGHWQAASRDWFQIYKPLLDARSARSVAAARGSPTVAPAWALAQLGQSLDGCVATASGDSYFVTGPESLLHLHRLRALCDAVVVGAGTVAADNPQLTTRRVPGPNAVRVVLDPSARLDGTAQVLRDATAPSLWLCDSRHAAAACRRATTGGAQVVGVDGLLTDAGTQQGVDPQRALAALAERGLRVVLIEGGGVTVSRCLVQGVLNRLHLVVAPVLIGNGRPGLRWPGAARMADCPRPPVQRLALGADMLWDLDLDLTPAPAQQG